MQTTPLSGWTTLKKIPWYSDNTLRISCFGNFIFPIADNIHNVYGKFLGNSKYWKDIFNKFRNRFLKESGHCGLNPLFVSISLYVLYTDYLFQLHFSQAPYNELIFFIISAIILVIFILKIVICSISKSFLSW